MSLARAPSYYKLVGKHSAFFSFEPGVFKRQGQQVDVDGSLLC